jgi:phage terminase small subunit
MPDDAKKKTKLSAKERRFVEEYPVDFNATQAAIRAGYSEKSARSIGAENLTKPHICAALKEALDALQAKATRTADEVLAELEHIAFANMQDYMGANADGDPVLDFSELTRGQAAALREVSVETYMEGVSKDAREVKRVRFKLHDKRAALIDLAKYHGLFGLFGKKPGAQGPKGKKELADEAAQTAGQGSEWGSDLDSPKSSSVN